MTREFRNVEIPKKRAATGCATQWHGPSPLHFFIVKSRLVSVKRSGLHVTPL